MRLALLASIAWVTRLTNPLFTIFSQEISARDLILLLGGLFLIWKASKEIHESIEGEEEGLKTRVSSFLGAIVQIMLLDIIFSLDSVITLFPDSGGLYPDSGKFRHPRTERLHLLCDVLLYCG